MTDERACWCGHGPLLPFNADYGRCEACETLVLKRAYAVRRDRVVDDDADFYGKDYWFGHQEDHHGFANLRDRARQDLIDRCVHWLTAVLKYKRPPAAALELGCAHGGFVALLKGIGFQASGLELSPWVANFAAETFGVDVLVGPIEDQRFPPGRFGLIAAMDVLEHLEDPLGTIHHIVHALAEDGLLLFQTPRYPEGVGYDRLVEEQSAFLQMLQPQEHTYLFSETAIKRLLREAGVEHVAFEPAIFAHYDMFIGASRAPLVATTEEDVAAVLTASPAARMIGGLLDLRAQNGDLESQLAERLAHVSWLKSTIARLEEDRAARLATIHEMGGRLGQIEGLEGDVAHLKAQVTAAESDRAARLEVIERQGQDLGRIPGLEADIAYLKQQIDGIEADRAARLALLEHQQLDLQARQQEIERLQQELGKMAALEAELGRVVVDFEGADVDRVALRRIIREQMTDVERMAALIEDLSGWRLRYVDLLRRLTDIRRSPVYRLLRSLGVFKSVDEPRTRVPD